MISKYLRSLLELFLLLFLWASRKKRKEAVNVTEDWKVIIIWKGFGSI